MAQRISEQVVESLTVGGNSFTPQTEIPVYVSKIGQDDPTNFYGGLVEFRDSNDSNSAEVPTYWTLALKNNIPNNGDNYIDRGIGIKLASSALSENDNWAGIRSTNYSSTVGNDMVYKNALDFYADNKRRIRLTHTSFIPNDDNELILGNSSKAWTKVYSNGLVANNSEDAADGGLSLWGPFSNSTIYGIARKAISASYGWVRPLPEEEADQRAMGVSAATGDGSGNDAMGIVFYNKGNGMEGWKFIYENEDGTRKNIGSINGLGYTQFNRLGLNYSQDNPQHGRLYWYAPNHYSWINYIGRSSAAGTAPTGGTPSKTSEVTSLALRSLITAGSSANGYGWIWEATSGAEDVKASNVSTTPKMSLSSYKGTLRLLSNAATNTVGGGNLIISSTENGSQGAVAIELFRSTIPSDDSTPTFVSRQIMNNNGVLTIRSNITSATTTTYNKEYQSEEEVSINAHGAVKINNASALGFPTSLADATGALVVKGGAYIGKNVKINGNIYVSSNNEYTSVTSKYYGVSIVGNGGGSIHISDVTPTINFYRNTNDNAGGSVTGRIQSDDSAAVHISGTAGSVAAEDNFNRPMQPTLKIDGRTLGTASIESNTYFMNNIGAVSDNTGYYLDYTNVKYGRLYVNVAGTTSAIGRTILSLGNNKASGTANNACGEIFLYGSNQYYQRILAQPNGSDRDVYLPNYNNVMYLTHTGSNDAVGSDLLPTYVATNGRLTPITNLHISKTTTADTYARVTNSNGSVEILASTNWGLYDRTNSDWIIVHNKANDDTYIPKWVSTGTATRGVYFNSNGRPALMNYSLNATIHSGTADHLAYYSADTAIDDTPNITVGNYSMTIGVTTNNTLAYYLENDLHKTSFYLAASGNKGIYQIAKNDDTAKWLLVWPHVETNSTYAYMPYSGLYIYSNSTSYSHSITPPGASAATDYKLIVGGKSYTSGMVHGRVGFSVFRASADDANSGGFILYEDNKVMGWVRISAKGTTSATGYTSLTLGNNIATGTAGNSAGQIYLYHTDTNYSFIRAAGWYSDTLENFTIRGKTSTTANTEAITRLTIGNNVAQTSTTAHTRGDLRIYSQSANYVSIYPGNLTSNITIGGEANYLTIPRLHLTATTDAASSDNNSVALVTGDWTGQHIEIDDNEILSKSNATTASTLFLQAGDGTVKVNGTGGLQVLSGPIESQGLIYISGNRSRYNPNIVSKNSAGNTVGEMWYDRGNATNVTMGSWVFRAYSPNTTNDTATTTYHETFSLPNVDTGRTSSASFTILTTKQNAAPAKGTASRIAYYSAAATISSGTIVTNGSYLHTAGVSSSWRLGRDNARFGVTSVNSYSPTLSTKTKNGSWEIGAYDHADYQNQLLFSYVPDTNYAEGGSNTSTAQVAFNNTGSIILKNQTSADRFFRVYSAASKDAGIEVIGTNYTIRFEIGSGNVNRGIYGMTESTWLLYWDDTPYARFNHNLGVKGKNNSYVFYVNGTARISSTLYGATVRAISASDARATTPSSTINTDISIRDKDDNVMSLIRHTHSTSGSHILYLYNYNSSGDLVTPLKSVATSTIANSYTETDCRFAATKTGGLSYTATSGTGAIMHPDGWIGTVFNGTASASNNGFFAYSGNSQYACMNVRTVGTTSTIGIGRLTLGNSKASGTAGNARGSILLYSDSDKYCQIYASEAVTANMSMQATYSGANLFVFSHGVKCTAGYFVTTMFGSSVPTAAPAAGNGSLYFVTI